MKPTWNNKTHLFGAILLICAICFCFTGCGSKAETTAQNQPTIQQQEQQNPTLTVHTYDAQDHKIDGYYAPQKGAYYLFVPSTQVLADTVVYYTDEAGNTGTIANAFTNNEDQVMVTDANGTQHKVIAMQSTLPSVYIDLNDTTLADIHADKDKKHKGNSIYITTLDGTYDLTVEDSVEVKGRGNSTWRAYEKKPYQIKFDDKTSVLGMGEAKKWILLANAGDDTMMRNQLVYQVAEQMDMPFVTSFEYVDLWIEGDYRGTFLLGEKVELGSSRLDLQNDSGALFEQDILFYSEEEYWFKSNTLQTEFVLKEIVEEEDNVIAIAMTEFETSLDELMNFVYHTAPENITLAQLSTMLDVDSFIKYYLINDYVLNGEALITSCYMYQDGPDDVIHFGPIWDFDTCLGNDGKTYVANRRQNQAMFLAFLDIPEVYQRTNELLEQYRPALESMTDKATTLNAQIADSAAMNYIRWDTLKDLNAKNDLYFYPTFDEAVDALYTWLTGRASVYDMTQPVYGVYRNIKGEVLYTSNDEEYTSLVTDGGKDYGIAWYAPVAGQPVHRLSGGLARLHYYTMDLAEKDALIAKGWNYEGIAWYTLNDGVPVYRMHKNSLLGDKYQYVTNQDTIVTLTSKGWTNQGVAWYGVEPK